MVLVDKASCLFPIMDKLTSPAYSNQISFLYRNSDFHCRPPPCSLLSPFSAKFSHLPPSLSPSLKLSPLNFRLCLHHGEEKQRIRVSAGLPESRESELVEDESDGAGLDYQGSAQIELGNGENQMGILAAALEAIPEANSAVISACLVGLLTGVGVVLFNYGVHELRDIFWDGYLERGASWLRREPIERTWQRTVSVPVCGGVLVSCLNGLRDSLNAPVQGELKLRIRAVLQPFLKTLASCITLGTGNSLGPEGPSVEIGSSIARGVGTLFGRSTKRKVPLVAAGSAAGIASGFNAAVAGCFFAVESVLWPSPDSAESLTNTTSMVILSAVIASVLSEVGLGAEPTFKVPVYDFRSASELPLYLLLGILCGLVSMVLTRCTTVMLHTVEEIQNAGDMPKAIFPIAGGLAVGLMALAYPEILYWGFQNVDLLLESRPFVDLSAYLLIQIVGVKIIATSFCRASGLVGGYYAPSLFIGAGTGMAYGKLVAFAVAQVNPVFHSSFFEVASPQAYALVAMAATLAGVCQVPLTSVLLLFELTQDYRIVLPLLAAVGMSSWITSPRVKRRDSGDALNKSGSPQKTQQGNASSSNRGSVYFGSSSYTKSSNVDDICEIESSRCFGDSDDETEELQRKIFVSQAMRTIFVRVFRNTLLVEAVSLMVAEKQSFALIVDDDNFLIGILSLEDIQEFSRSAQTRRKPEELLVADLCSLESKKCDILWTATPLMDLLSAEMIMVRHGLSQLPVVSEHGEGCKGQAVGVIDMQCIMLACRAVVTQEYLSQNFVTGRGVRK